MALHNPKGRVNYEPNSWEGDVAGPRECPVQGYTSFPAEEQGTKQRVRSETFSDHYSQARQFYISQTGTEQDHIAAALTFELSKVKALAIRSRMVAHLLNIDADLAQTVAEGLRLKMMPTPADAARPTRQDLPASPALGLIQNGPQRFEGRKLGVLVTDGVDGALLAALRSAIKAAGATLEIVAPAVGGVTASDGSWIEADEKLDGGPSVLFDAVALLVSEAGAKLLEHEPAARDFVADAFAHAKFIGHVATAAPLLAKSGVEPDSGVIALTGPEAVGGFIEACGRLRLWAREGRIKRV